MQSQWINLYVPISTHNVMSNEQVELVSSQSWKLAVTLKFNIKLTVHN